MNFLCNTCPKICVCNKIILIKMRVIKLKSVKSFIFEIVDLLIINSFAAHHCNCRGSEYELTKLVIKNKQTHL